MDVLGGGRMRGGRLGRVLPLKLTPWWREGTGVSAAVTAWFVAVMLVTA